MMATRLNANEINSSGVQYRQRKLTKRSIRHADCAPAIRIDLGRSETTLSPNDELECCQIYEKLQRLQPNGVCVNLDTLRRALYPPSSLSRNINDQLLTFKSYRQRGNEMPQIRASNVPQQNKGNKIDCINIDRVINQVKKHAAINYSYYTRTK